MQSYLDDAESRLVRFFSNGGWEIWDGVPIQQDNALLVTDLAISVALNSQLDNRLKVWTAWKAKPRVDRLLARIPANISLTDPNVPWREIEELIDAFGRQGATKYVLWAVSTKVLHKKRPHLIPVLDDAICAFLFQELSGLSWSNSSGAAFIQYLAAFRNHLNRDYAVILDLQFRMEERGWPVSVVRILELLIWIANSKGGGEYRNEPA